MSPRDGDLILAADVGGTNVRLALFALEGDRLVERVREKLPTRNVSSLPDAVRDFTADHGGRVTAAGFGVAGPVRNGRVEAPNLPWAVERETLARALELSNVVLINDLFANATGISELNDEDFFVVNEGTPDPAGNGALISAGTGLGMALLIRQGGRFHPQPSEGGHASFAPNGPDELALLTFLSRTYSHVSFERVLSGPGLLHVYQFERERSRVPGIDLIVEAARSGSDPAAAIAEAAHGGKDAVAELAMKSFIGLYGSAAGNLALTVLATAGVFLGGGIAPKIRASIAQGPFFGAFTEKGRFSALLRDIPVKIILNDACALLGAAPAGADSGFAPAA